VSAFLSITDEKFCTNLALWANTGRLRLAT
jgi:hypothetical protein